MSAKLTPSHAMAVAVTALVMAVGGTSYAEKSPHDHGQVAEAAGPVLPAPATLAGERVAIERHTSAAKRQRIATKRQRLATKRQRLATKRQRIATKRQRVATKRQRLATKRQRLAAKRQ